MCVVFLWLDIVNYHEFGKMVTCVTIDVSCRDPCLLFQPFWLFINMLPGQYVCKSQLFTIIIIMESTTGRCYAASFLCTARNWKCQKLTTLVLENALEKTRCAFHPDGRCAPCYPIWSGEYSVSINSLSVALWFFYTFSFGQCKEKRPHNTFLLLIPLQADHYESLWRYQSITPMHTVQ